MISRTLLSIIAHFSCLDGLDFLSDLPFYLVFSRFFGNVSRTPTTIGIIFTFMFRKFFSSPAESIYLSNFLVYFILWFARTVNSSRWKSSFFFLIKTRYGLLAGVRWSIYMKTSQWISLSFSRTDSDFYISFESLLFPFCGQPRQQNLRNGKLSLSLFSLSLSLSLLSLSLSLSSFSLSLSLLSLSLSLWINTKSGILIKI